MKRLLLTTLVLATAACNPPSSSPGPAASGPVSASTAAPAAAPAMAKASVGALAPDFTLTGIDGKAVTLSSFKGKTVVLEWFNPGCPFIKAAHTKGSLKGMAARREAEGIVWLAVNSSAPGKEGGDPAKSVAAKAAFGLDHPILLDPTGAVGHAYGATNTPNMFVIDASGTLVYRGAIDNSPDGEAESPTDGKLVNYVDAALDALAAKRDVAVKETKAYGCSVKYQ
jgi:peroxiredoxin